MSFKNSEQGEGLLFSVQMKGISDKKNWKPALRNSGYYTYRLP